MFRTIGMLGSSIRGRTSTLDTISDPPRRRGLRARLRAHALTRVPYLGLIALTGAAVVTLGIVLLPLPGPGWLIIFIGLGIWATEFRWAARLLRWLRARVRAWTAWLTRQAPYVRALVATALLLLVVAAAGTTYVLLYGTPAWLPAWLPLVD